MPKVLERNFWQDGAKIQGFAVDDNFIIENTYTNLFF